MTKAQVDTTQFGEGELLDLHVTPGETPKVWVVAHHGDTVEARVDVGLDVGRTGGDRLGKGEHRVLGRLQRKSPVRENTGTCGGEVCARWATWARGPCHRRIPR
mgnify:CR=1 FL=1